ncbi:MAG: TolC family protein [Thiotrichaceae bacterium]|nr:TolC family protein [Thiotrichaceae bacterium]
MNKKFMGLTLLILQCLSPSISLAAAHSDSLQTSKQLSLHAIVEHTFERHPNLQVLTARIQEAEALSKAANTLLAGSPAVTLRHQTDQLGSRTGLREWEAGLEMPLWFPAQKAARQYLAEQAQQNIPIAKTALSLLIAGQVREYLWEIAWQKNLLALSTQEMNAAKVIENKVRRRFELGELARTDLLLAQEESLRKQTALLNVQTEVQHAQKRYELFTGLNQIPSDYQEQLSPLEEINLEHPLLNQAQSKVVQAQAQVQVSRAEKRENPQLTLGVRRERSRANDDPYQNSIGLSVRIPLGNEAHAATRITTAERVQAELQSERDLLKRELEIALHEAEHMLNTYRETLVLAKQQHQLAQENLRLTRQAFEIGEADLVSLQRVQALAFAAERTALQQSLAVQRAISRYNQAVGVLP